MAYTPELSQEHSCTLRRIAWALDTPMTNAMALIFNHLGKILNQRKVCNKCRDRTKCSTCVFSKGSGNT